VGVCAHQRGRPRHPRPAQDSGARCPDRRAGPGGDRGGEELDPAAGLAVRLGAVTGARRSELCALRWTDLDGDRLVIDSSIAIVRRGKVGDKGKPILEDAATKTANRRTVRLDPRTIAAFEALRVERESWGPWVLQVGDRPLNPERLTAWWRLARRLGLWARRAVVGTAAVRLTKIGLVGRGDDHCVGHLAGHPRRADTVGKVAALRSGWSWWSSSGVTIRVRAAPGVGFKRCCMVDGQFDGAPRQYYRRD